MLTRARRYGRDWLAGGGYLMLIFFGFSQQSASAWAVVFAATLTLALLAWLASLRHLRAVRDTPTSRIASAAQGYVKLAGKGQPMPGFPLHSPTHRLPCLWYRYRAFTRQDNKWQQTETGESAATFLLDDGSGFCVIDAEAADVLASHQETYIQGDDKVEEELLLAGDTLYVLGGLSSRGGGHSGFDAREAMARTLAEWKANQADLHARFDLDRNGTIDASEWQLARQAARRESEAQRHQALSQPVVHELGPPGHGRPHLIADFPINRLVRRYRWRAWLHGGATGASLIGLAIALQRYY
jgi:hypothetical protein